MAIVERGICKITMLNSKGLGAGIYNNEVVELPYVLPEEIVEFTKHQYRENTSFNLEKISLCSELRGKPPCDYFGICGGCLLQHLSSKGYIKFKYKLIQDALARYAIGFYFFDQDTEFLPNTSFALIKKMLSIPISQRRRADLEVVKKEDKIFLGFHRYKSHQIADIDKCLVLDPSLSNLLKPLNELCSKLLLDRQKAQIFLTNSSNGIDLILEIKGLPQISLAQKSILRKFSTEYSIIRTIYRHNNSWDVVHKTATPYVEFDGVRVEIDSHDFLQVSKWSDQVLANIVLQALAEKFSSKITIADLFCGRGTITMPLSRGHIVDGFEMSKQSIKALGRAAKEGNRAISLYERDLFIDPLSWNELNRYDMVVINPPRAGAKAQSISMKNATPEVICYISCNPETFARDASILLSGHYSLESILPIDQFYWSPHIELVGLFYKRS